MERYAPYRAKEDGPWFIGYGSKRIGRSAVTPFIRCNRKEIEKQLERDLEEFVFILQDLIFFPLNEKKKAAVLSYAYSIGITKFKDCRLLSLINSNADRTEIIKEWSPFINKELLWNTKLTDRRRSELDLYLQPDTDVPLLVEHQCKLPKCLLNIAENFNGSPQQVKAIEFLEEHLLRLDPKHEIIDEFFRLWNQRPKATGSRSLYSEDDLETLEVLRYASSLIPQELDQLDNQVP
jgi:GH24 family phage-related lysozyme (muramidase)